MVGGRGAGSSSRTVFMACIWGPVLVSKPVAKAQAFTGLKEKSSLIREALKALIERKSARRLARLGGSEPGLKAPPRRRSIAG